MMKTLSICGTKYVKKNITYNITMALDMSTFQTMKQAADTVERPR